MDTMASLRSFFECSICLEGYKNPKALSCFHAYCLQCIQAFDGTETIKCPLCRQLTCIPVGGVDELPDYVNKDGTSSTDRGGHCGFCCNETVAEFFCTDCEDSLCLKCKEHHLRMKQTKTHVLDVMGARHVVKKFESLWCQIHPSYKVKYYCSKCDQGCCDLCCRHIHEDHTMENLHEFAEGKRQKIGANIEESKIYFTTIVDDIADILIDQDNLNSLHEKHRLDIDNFADELKRKIDQNSETMKEDLKQNFETLNEKLTLSLETNKTRTKSVIGLVQSTSEILNEASDLDFVSLERDLMAQLNEEKANAKVKDVRVSYLVASKVEESMIASLQKKSDHKSQSLIQPLILNKVTRSLRVPLKLVSSMACLADGSFIACDNNSRKIRRLSVRGEDFGSLNMPFRVGSFIPIGNTIFVAEFNGRRVGKFSMDSEIDEVRRVGVFVNGISRTADKTGIIWCCNVTNKEVTTKSNAKRPQNFNGKFIITNEDLDELVQINIKSGGEVLRYANEKRDGDFVVMSSKSCFTLSRTGVVKSRYTFDYFVRGICINKQDNVLVLHGEDDSIRLSIHDSIFASSKEVYSFGGTLPKSKICCMTLDASDSLWVGAGDKIMCIKYTF